MPRNPLNFLTIGTIGSVAIEFEHFNVGELMNLRDFDSTILGAPFGTKRRFSVTTILGAKLGCNADEDPGVPA